MNPQTRYNGSKNVPNLKVHNYTDVNNDWAKKERLRPIFSEEKKRREKTEFYN